MCQSHVLRLLGRSQRQISTDSPAVAVAPTAGVSGWFFFRGIYSSCCKYSQTYWTRQSIRKAAIGLWTPAISSVSSRRIPLIVHNVYTFLPIYGHLTRSEGHSLMKPDIMEIIQYHNLPRHTCWWPYIGWNLSYVLKYVSGLFQSENVHTTIGTL
jgi:hypothetical protein